MTLEPRVLYRALLRHTRQETNGLDMRCPQISSFDRALESRTLLDGIQA